MHLLSVIVRGSPYKIDNSFLAKSSEQYVVHIRHESCPSVLWFRLCETIGEDHDIFGVSEDLPTSRWLLNGKSNRGQQEPYRTQFTCDASMLVTNRCLTEHDQKSLRSRENLDIISRNDG